ncbi:activator of Hsp90 ATPase N-terminal domain-containing protein [Alcanivorax sp. S6407]|uniref:activator of Hsp90 ATPase N-terminal domain-containing protein n=1 Tax=Alcanivorax sp. S6407 TaxID=2926424 RepID=UPI001FF10391|nr:activator of Hsp90 ATPase N-terminal domain-containing protein [Alcanivorax sp. S6407]MCK0154371.1 activator of Hsp90 ATPase N-terminal domain-containing protein [Alcanivorax sp. S6407]
MSLKERLSADSLMESLPVSRDLLTRLGLLGAQVSRKIAIDQVSVDNGTLNNLKVEKVNLGSASIGSLTVQNGSASVNNANAVLNQVRSIVELEFHLDWEIDLGWIGSWDGSENMGSLDIPVDLGTITVPDLGDIDLQIPSIDIPGLVAEMKPIDQLDLGNLDISGVRLDKLSLPSAGLSITGMGVGDLTLSSVTVPSADGEAMRVNRAAPTRHLNLPGASLENVAIPAINMPSATSGSFTADATASDKSVGVDIGILKVSVRVTPTVHLNVGSMTLSDAQLAADLGKVSINDISLPVSLEGITGGELGLNNISVNKLTF